MVTLNHFDIEDVRSRLSPMAMPWPRYLARVFLVRKILQLRKEKLWNRWQQIARMYIIWTRSGLVITSTMVQVVCQACQNLSAAKAARGSTGTTSVHVVPKRNGGEFPAVFLH